MLWETSRDMLSVSPATESYPCQPECLLALQVPRQLHCKGLQRQTDVHCRLLTWGLHIRERHLSRGTPALLHMSYILTAADYIWRNLQACARPVRRRNLPFALHGARLRDIWTDMLCLQGKLFKGAALFAPMLSLERASQHGLNYYLRSQLSVLDLFHPGMYCDRQWLLHMVEGCLGSVTSPML